VHLHIINRLTRFIAIILFFTHCNFPKIKNQNINIVLIVADDLGYGDIGCYGGDIETPNIDDLAYNGIRFSCFHTAPMCAPTRAMLLTGNDNHIAGIGDQLNVTEQFGYEGKLTSRVITMPQLLRNVGYHTYMVGKWHLGTQLESNPHQKGFEHSFVLLQGAGNHYRNQSVLGRGVSDYTEDGNTTTWQDDNYSTDYYTDKIIEYIDLHKDDGNPFFAYLAYTAPHWPLQVDKKFWRKYSGNYDNGYEKLRERRLASLKKVGIIPQNARLPRYHESVKSWNLLSDDEKKIEARKMELYAGMVDNLDHNIGRFIQYLKKIERYDNTLFIFMSDNGAAYRDLINSPNFNFLRENYNNDYENMGEADSYISYGSPWAEAGSSPFRYFKDYATQGGINTTMIISGPFVERENEIHHVFTNVLDIAPTVYEISGANYPKVYNGNEVYPLRGSSLVPFISGKVDEVHSSDYIFAIEHHGHAMLRKGIWKITNFKQPFDIKNFSLYNLSNDLGEQRDLKYTEPKKYKELLIEWEKFSKEVRINFSEP
jgi:arylsulfatase A-like enzyme